MMTNRIKTPKWVLYRHTRDFNMICKVAYILKNELGGSISTEDKDLLIDKLRSVRLYDPRNLSLPQDAVNHRINTLCYFMFGYKSKVNNARKFLFSPLGNLFMKHLSDVKKRSFIFLTMLLSIQWPHPHGGTDKDLFTLYPYRLLFKLMLDPRLGGFLYAFEYALIIPFVRTIDSDSYQRLVVKILHYRRFSNDKITELAMQDEHAHVNATYEWDYYQAPLLESASILQIENGDEICKLYQGTSTRRKLTRNKVSLNPEIIPYCTKLLKAYPFDAPILDLKDPTRLRIDATKQLYSFLPSELLDEINDSEAKVSTTLLDLPKLLEEYSNNISGTEYNSFEEKLEEGFNMFHNVEAKRISGAGNTDIECLYLSKKIKFAVDAKSTKNKLSSLNSGRLAKHRRDIGGEYTIIVTPRYVPAVKHDIADTPIVILLASTFSEYLYNSILFNRDNIDYADFHNIIEENYGSDISGAVSNLTISRFGVGG